MDPAAWRNMLDEEVKALQESYKVRGVEAEDGDGGTGDPYAPMLRALELEITQYHDEVLKPHFRNFVAAVGKGEVYVSPYGPEIGEGNDARYEFWPSMTGKWPLLYLCACWLLAGDVNSTCFSERMHSPAGRIMSKFRASMKPQKTERLTLGYFLVRADIKKKIAEKAITEAMLDAEELAAECEGAPALEVDGVLDMT